MNKLVAGVCTIVELGCILGLAGIALKRNNDAYKAERKCVDAELKALYSEMNLMLKDAEICDLKKELKRKNKTFENA